MERLSVTLLQESLGSGDVKKQKLLADFTPTNVN